MHTQYACQSVIYNFVMQAHGDQCILNALQFQFTKGLIFISMQSMSHDRKPFRIKWYSIGAIWLWFDLCFQSITYCYMIYTYHDDVIKWKHFPRYWPLVRGIHRSPVDSSHKDQWRGALMFSLICVWINGWINNRWWFETLLRPL